MILVFDTKHSSFKFGSALWEEISAGTNFHAFRGLWSKLQNQIPFLTTVNVENEIP